MLRAKHHFSLKATNNQLNVKAYISTRSTLMPQGSVASSSIFCHISISSIEMINATFANINTPLDNSISSIEYQMLCLHHSKGGLFHYVGGKLPYHFLYKDIEKDNLHRGRYAFSVAEDFVQVLCPQNIPQGGLGQ